MYEADLHVQTPGAEGLQNTTCSFPYFTKKKFTVATLENKYVNETFYLENKH